MNSLRRLPTLLCLCMPLLASGLSLKAFDGVDGQVERWGIFSAKSDPRSTPSDSTAGYHSILQTQLVRQTQHVPISDGVVFGYQFRIVDYDAYEAWVPVTVHYHHPRTVNHRGQPSTGFSVEITAHRMEDGSFGNGAFYVLREAFEKVPGDWQISVEYRGRTLLTKTFTLYDTSTTPAPTVDLAQNER